MPSVTAYFELPSSNFTVSAATHGAITIATNKSPTKKSCMSRPLGSIDAYEKVDIRAIGRNIACVHTHLVAIET